MRFRSILLLALPGLATACEPALEAGPRVQFVGDARLTTTARRLTTPADTVTTRIYARADDSPLERVRITIDYDPVPEPIVYSDFPGERPKAQLMYLDTTYRSVSELAFQSTQPTRSTAGSETWRYEVFDAKGRKGMRTLRLSLSRPDSLASYHSYTITLQAPRPETFDTRRFLALREGLALPGFSVLNQPANQQRIDLVYRLDQATTAPVLSRPDDELLKLNWPQRRATEIRALNFGSTFLDSTNFQNASTPVLLRSVFDNGASFVQPTSTGPLRQGQLLAFLTPEGKAGLLRVVRIGTSNQRQLVVQVRVAK